MEDEIECEIWSTNWSKGLTPLPEDSSPVFHPEFSERTSVVAPTTSSTTPVPFVLQHSPTISPLTTTLSESFGGMTVSQSSTFTTSDDDEPTNDFILVYDEKLSHLRDLFPPLRANRTAQCNDLQWDTSSLCEASNLREEFAFRCFMRIAESTVGAALAINSIAKKGSVWWEWLGRVDCSPMDSIVRLYHNFEDYPTTGNPTDAPHLRIYGASTYIPLSAFAHLVTSVCDIPIRSIARPATHIAIWLSVPQEELLRSIRKAHRLLCSGCLWVGPHFALLAPRNLLESFGQEISAFSGLDVYPVLGLTPSASPPIPRRAIPSTICTVQYSQMCLPVSFPEMNLWNVHIAYPPAYVPFAFIVAFFLQRGIPAVRVQPAPCYLTLVTTRDPTHHPIFIEGSVLFTPAAALVAMTSEERSYLHAYRVATRAGSCLRSNVSFLNLIEVEKASTARTQ